MTLSTQDVDVVFTIEEVADQLRVSKMTIYRLVHSGELDAFRIGKSFRIEKRALNEFLQRV